MDRRKFIKVSSSVAGTIALSHVGGSFLAHAEEAPKKAAMETEEEPIELLVDIYGRAVFKVVLKAFLRPRFPF